MRLFTKAAFVNQKTRFTNAALVKAAFVNVIYECGYAFVNLKPLKPSAHSEEYTNAAI